MKKLLALFISIALLMAIQSTIIIAQTSEENLEETEEEKDCLPMEGFIKYEKTSQDVIMPNLGETVVLEWNFQCTHETTITVKDENNNIVDTIATSQTFTKGDNTYTWDGNKGNEALPNGQYEIIITPNDDFSIYPARFSVKVYHFPYQSLIDIYGQDIVENIREEL